MKKFAVTLLIMSVLMPFSALASEVNESILRVESSINTEVAPDTVKIRLFVDNSGINLNDIKEKNDKIVNEAISKIKGKLSSNESIKTISYRINSVYSYKDKIRMFQKYEVSNGFEVKLKDMSKISEIIKIATDSGVKRIDAINFSIEDGDALCNEMMSKAINQAKSRAQILSQSAGTSLLKVKEINPYCSLNSTFVQPRYLNASMKSMGAMADSSSEAIEAIEPGTMNVRANVNMTYYLK